LIINALASATYDGGLPRRGKSPLELSKKPDEPFTRRKFYRQDRDNLPVENRKSLFIQRCRKGWVGEMEGAMGRKVQQGKQLLPQEVFNEKSQKGTTLAFWKEDALVLNIWLLSKAFAEIPPFPSLKKGGGGGI
jgi:hypothetical protein